HFIKGPEAMRAAIMLNDLISFDRNFGLKPDRRLPRGRMLSKQEFLDIVPFIRRESLNGGALWYDGLMVNSERLLFAFLHFAAERGLTVANYVKAESLLLEKNRVVGVTVYDRLGDQRFDVRAKLTVAAPGSRLNDILRQTADQPEVRFSTAVNLVLSRRFTSEYAFAAPTQRRYKDQDALIDRGSRLLFFVPWRGVTLAGTAHQPYLGDPADYHVTEEEVESFLAEVNSALPDAQIRRDEVRHVYAGLLPMASASPAGDVTLVKHYRVIDHEKSTGHPGLITVMSVKYTTARGVAEEVTKKFILPKLGIKSDTIDSSGMPLWGGDFEDFSALIAELQRNWGDHLTDESALHLAECYGANARRVLSCDPDAGRPLVSGQPFVKGQVLFAVREEAAQKLSDILLRRTEIGAAGRPAEELILAASEAAAKELNWSAEKKAREIQEYLLNYALPSKKNE
ncbi:MAG: FAD-dependent oxidoreductase, partial [candidate division KSB1 bacterium]|nr:FAD-dependent oxidoreductase [candidate division KSB1 bacterium]